MRRFPRSRRPFRRSSRSFRRSSFFTARRPFSLRGGLPGVSAFQRRAFGRRYSPLTFGLQPGAFVTKPFFGPHFVPDGPHYTPTLPGQQNYFDLVAAHDPPIRLPKSFTSSSSKRSSLARIGRR
jgi:hypothetical protein